MKVVTVSGVQGSGKTTLIRSAAARLHGANKRSAVIVNERGEADFDEDFNTAHQLTVERLRGG
jgi:G3E family GTPase